MKNEILTQLFKSKEIDDLIQKMQPDHLRDEIKSELFLTLCEMPEEKLSALHVTKQLRFYVVRIVLNMVQSSSSPFFKKYRKVIMQSLDDNTTRSRSDSEDFGLPVFKNQAADNEEETQSREQQENALLEAVEKSLGNMHWYTRELFKLYVHYGSAGKVIKAMKEDLGGHYIPRRTILDVVKKAKTEIRENSEVKKALVA